MMPDGPQSPRDENSEQAPGRLTRRSLRSIANTRSSASGCSRCSTKRRCTWPWSRDPSCALRWSIGACASLAGGVAGQERARHLSRGQPADRTLERVYATGVPETIHGLPPYFPDGAHADRFFTRHFVPLRDEHGNVLRSCTVYEVTEDVRARHAHREAERRNQVELQRLSALLEEAPVLINVLEGPELRIVMMNRRTRELFAGRDLLGVSFTRSRSPHQPHAAWPPAGSTQTGVPETFEVDGPRCRRLRRPLVLHHGGADPRPGRQDHAHHDRVARHSPSNGGRRRRSKAQARDLETARRQAVEASRAKDEFLAMLGHELRNPLAPIVMTLELMRLRGTATSAEVELLTRQVRHLVRLVDDLLDVSRIARGLVELAVPRRRVVGDREPRAGDDQPPDRAAPATDHRATSAPATVHGDPDRLAQVVANLITNAAKYSESRLPDPHPHGALGRARQGQRRRRWCRHRARHARPGVRSPSCNNLRRWPGRRAGWGWGCPSSRVWSRPTEERCPPTARAWARAARSSSSCPRSNVPTPRPDGRPARGAAAPVRHRRGGSWSWMTTVMPPSRSSGRSRRWARSWQVAHDGPSALREALAFEPQIGLLDIGLPGMDGYELAAALRAAHDLRLFAITGYGQPRDRQRSRDAGFEEHLVKPVDIAQLARMMRELSVDKARRSS